MNETIQAALLGTKALRVGRVGISKPWHWALLGVLFLVVLHAQAGSNLTGNIGSVGFPVSGGEQYLYFAPGSPDRSQVQVSVVTSFSATANVIGAQYRYAARLLDAAGNPVNLRGADGLPTLAYAFPQFSVTIGAGRDEERFHTLSFSIADGVRLNPYLPYRVELTLQYLAGAIWTPEGPVRTSSSRRFFHFLNQTSGDVPYNVIAEILGVEWKRTHAIDSATGDAHWLEAEVVYRLHRYDNFSFGPGPAAPADHIPVRFAVAVRTGLGTTLAATVDAGDTLTTTAAYREGLPRSPWASGVQIRRLRFHPDVQLPSGTEPNFRAAVTISHVENFFGGSYVAGNTVDSENATVLHFTGRLDWGAVTTSLRDFSNDPTLGLVRRSGDVSVSLQNGVAVTPGVASSFTVNPLIQVSLDDAGTARVLSGNGSVGLATPDRTLHGIRYQVPGTIQLGPSGAAADVTLRLPAGMGVGKPGFALNARLTRHLTAFNSLFEPTGTNSFPLLADERVVLDTRPLYFPAPELKWLPFAGELQFTPGGVDYVRHEAFETLAAATDLPADQTSKPSNERYYQFVAGVAGTFTVRVTPAGRTGLSAKFTLLPGQFVSHFPLDVTTAWSAGQLFLQDDQPIGISSGLVPVGPIMVAYEQGCPDGGCEGQTAELACDVPQLFFTPDSGLLAEGNTAASVGSENWLRWGRNPGREVMAHEVGPFQKAAFAMSGHVLLGGALPAAEIANGAGVLLESGAALSANTNSLPSGVRMIRPGTVDYRNGVGQYAGLNLHRAIESVPSGVFGLARLGDAVSEAGFALSSRVKYYARRSGVSGLHEAEDGGFPAAPLAIYRYPFEFQSFALSFLSNENVDSKTRCEIKLPAPVDDRFVFDSLTFTCVGAPDDAVIAGGQSERIFRYWLAAIDAQGVEFAPRDRTASACDASQQRFLGLGSVVHGSGIRNSLAGTLYLSAEGDIITPADSERPEGVSFYLGGSAILSVAGTIDGTTRLPTSYYYLTLGKAYFNQPDPFERTESGRGWLNLFGGLKLPFYGQTPVHLMALGTKNGDPESPSFPSDLASVYYINGGWTDGAVPAADPTGDLNHRGVPPGLTWADYRGNTAFAPQARGEFLDVINLDFPLQWLSALREFTGVEPIEHSLLFLLQTSRELHRLSATDIAMELGAAYEGLPRLHLTTGKIDLIFDSYDVSDLNVTRDLGRVVAEALGEELTEDVASGFASMRTIADERLAGQVRTLARLLVAGVAPELRTAMEGDAAGREARINDAFELLVLDERTLLLAEGLAEPGLRAALVSQLATASASLRSLWAADTGVFIRDADGGRIRLATVIRELLIRGLDLNPGAAAVVGSLGAPGFADLLRPFDSEMTRLEGVMFHVADRVDELRARYASDSADLYLELRALFADPVVVAELNGLINQARLDLIALANEPHWVEENVSGPGDAFELVLAGNVENRLFASEFFARLQRTFRYHLRSVEEDGVSAVDGVMVVLQRMINQLGRIALRAAEDFAYGELLDSWDGILGFANAEGYVHFSGDEVRRLRLLAKGGINFGTSDGSTGPGVSTSSHTDYGFQGSFLVEIKSLDSEGERFCVAGSPATAGECVMEFSTEESRDTAETWIATAPEDDELYGMRLPSDPPFPPTEETRRRSTESFLVRLKATFDSEAGITGFGGGFAWATKKDFGAVRVARVAGACMFGLTENYLAGAVEGTFGGENGVQVQGGVFVGRTCTFEPLALINPDVVRVLGAERPFTGFYAYARGWVPIVSAGCLLNLSAGLGAGVILDFESGRYGGELFAGVRGEVLCLLAATGELSGTGLSDDGDFVFDVTGRLKVRLGYCPFCVKFGKEIGARYHSGTGDWELR